MMQLRSLLVILLLLVGASAKAEPFAALGMSLNFEQAPDGRTIETRQPLAVRGGYRFQPVDVYLDYQTFNATQGTPLVHVARTPITSGWSMYGESSSASGRLVLTARSVSAFNTT